MSRADRTTNKKIKNSLIFFGRVESAETFSLASLRLSTQSQWVIVRSPGSVSDSPMRAQSCINESQSSGHSPFIHSFGNLLCKPSLRHLYPKLNFQGRKMHSCPHHQYLLVNSWWPQWYFSCFLVGWRKFHGLDEVYSLGCPINSAKNM